MDAATRQIVVLCLQAGGALTVLGLAVWFTRRWMRRDDTDAGGPVFTLQDLREMRDDGQITIAEYENLRAGILAIAGSRPIPAEKPQVQPPAENDGLNTTE